MKTHRVTYRRTNVPGDIVERDYTALDTISHAVKWGEERGLTICGIYRIPKAPKGGNK